MTAAGGANGWKEERKDGGPLGRDGPDGSRDGGGRGDW